YISSRRPAASPLRLGVAAPPFDAPAFLVESGLPSIGRRFDVLVRAANLRLANVVVYQQLEFPSELVRRERRTGEFASTFGQPEDVTKGDALPGPERTLNGHRREYKGLRRFESTGATVASARAVQSRTPV